MEFNNQITIWRFTDLEIFDRRNKEVLKINFFINENEKESAIDNTIKHLDNLGFDYCGYKIADFQTMDLDLPILFDQAEKYYENQR